jgi:hypothetical protein
MPSLPTLAAYGIGLVVTLVLAARLTPRTWWRRANARALAVLAAGTTVIGSALAALAEPVLHPAARASDALSEAAREAPMPGRAYRVRDDLNLRDASGTGARRIGVVGSGSIVTATGARDGDWWQVRARLGGREVQGWASSLWLRRADEARR